MYAQSNKVVIVMGLHAVGGSVDEVCHRPECVKEALDCDGAHLLTRTNLDVLMAVYEKKIGQQFPGMETERRYFKKSSRHYRFTMLKSKQLKKKETLNR